MPEKIFNHREALCRRYLSSNTYEATRKAPNSWDIIFQPKSAGGLNITDLKDWNRATIGKLLWNLQGKADKLWVKWINTYYLKKKDIMNWTLNKNCSWIIKRIIKCMDSFKNIHYWKEVELGKSYNTGNMYKAMRGDFEKVTWHKMLASNYARPRAIFTLWMVLNGKLPTG